MFTRDILPARGEELEEQEEEERRRERSKECERARSKDQERERARNGKRGKEKGVGSGPHLILLVQLLHCCVEVPEEPVPEQLVIHQVELPAGVVVAEPITLSREVQPLRVAKLITCSSSSSSSNNNNNNNLRVKRASLTCQ